jgi:hypothetical protein
VVVSVIGFAGCATAPGIPEDARALEGAPATVESGGGGEIVAAVDATSEETWTYFDLDGSGIVQVADPFEESTWDLAFQRFNVKSNGGSSGNGNVEIAVSGTDDFTQPLPTGSLEWYSDTGSGDRISYAFAADGNWYKYSFATHTLESRRMVMAVRSTEGVVYRLQMLTYYDQFLIAGFPTFRYIAQ